MGAFEYDVDDLIQIEESIGMARPAAVYQRAAPEVERLITEQFWAGTDPFGNTWASLKRTGEPSHLIDTGTLLSSVHITGQPDGFDFAMENYGAYHQTGTERMFARPILPLAGEYPDSWDAAVADAVIAICPTLERG